MPRYWSPESKDYAEVGDVRWEAETAQLPFGAEFPDGIVYTTSYHSTRCGALAAISKRPSDYDPRVRTVQFRAVPGTGIGSWEPVGDWQEV